MNRHKSPEILPVNSFMDIRPIDLKARQIGTLAVDIENIFTPYHVPEIGAAAAAHVDLLKSEVDKLDIILVTNNDNEPQDGQDIGLADYVARELGVRVIHPSMGYKKKPSPAMLYAARSYSTSPMAPAAFVDDQFKNYIAAKRAEFDVFFWPKPYGKEMHPGVRAVHNIVERPLLRPMIKVAKSVQDVYRSGL